MAYNYFVCRKHVPPVTYAAVVNDHAPLAYASPLCPTCHKTMQHYGRGNALATPPLPPDGPAPVFAVPQALPDVDAPIYNGWGMNPGHGKVTWEIFHNLAKMELTIVLKFGDFVANSWDSVKRFRMVDGTLNLGQGGNRRDWWLGSPFKANPNIEVWHSFSLINLVGPAGLGGAPGVIDIGVKLGDAVFGLIHLLSGHSDSILKIGTLTVTKADIPKDNELRTIVSLQAGMARFDEASIRRIRYDVTEDKFLIEGAFSGFIVLRRMPGDPRYAITTMYNKNPKPFGIALYEK
jgi:hypothetical protein